MLIRSASPDLAHPGSQTTGAQMVHFMLKPPAFEAAHIEFFCRHLGLIRNHPPSQFHFTLASFGDFRDLSRSDLSCLVSAAASLLAEPFQITLDKSQGCELVGSDMRKLRTFQRMLVRRLRAFGFDIPARKFRPHLSLVYDKERTRQTSIAPFSWIADEFLLINSIHGHGHKVLGSWQLSKRQGELFL